MKYSMGKQHGFTMIELIMVIVILGILAAFALPRFANLGGDARRSVLNGALASVRSASAIAHSAQLAAGNTGNTSVTMEDSTVITMRNGYPTANAGGIISASQLSADFITTGGGAGAGAVLNIRIANAPTPANCSFTYTAATAPGAPIFGVPVTTGC